MPYVVINPVFCATPKCPALLCPWEEHYIEAHDKPVCKRCAEALAQQEG